MSAICTSQPKQSSPKHPRQRKTSIKKSRPVSFCKRQRMGRSGDSHSTWRVTNKHKKEHRMARRRINLAQHGPFLLPEAPQQRKNNRSNRRKAKKPHRQVPKAVLIIQQAHNPRQKQSRRTIAPSTPNKGKKHAQNTTSHEFRC